MDVLNNKNFEKLDICPLCKKNKFLSFSSKYKNVYSDLISKDLAIDEKLLFQKNSVLKCANCSLIFWKYKLSNSFRKRLYSQILPNHPKGEDSSGKSFNLLSLINRLDKLDKLSNQKIRIIEGYLRSFKLNSKSEYLKVKKILFNQAFSEKSNKVFINEIFNRGPKELSRYKGFRDTILNSIIQDIFDNSSYIEKYIEYGCTSWGPMTNIISSGKSCFSIIPNRDIFWDCRSHSPNFDSKNYKIIDQSDIGNPKRIFDGSICNLILILDHIDKPYEFLKEIIDYGAKFLIIVLEKFKDNGDLPIQHLTGWSKTSLSYLAKELKADIKFINLGSELYNSALIIPK